MFRSNPLTPFIALLLLLLFSSAAPARELFLSGSKNTAMYHNAWIDFNKNGTLDIFENPAASMDDRIEDLLAQMTLDEKTVQLATLYGYGRVARDELPTDAWKSALWKDGIGNIDEHLNGLAYHPQTATEYSWPPSKHARAINQVQRFFVEDTRLGIPVDFTNEGIRGLCHKKAASFPAQIGQGSTWDPELIYEIGRITGREARALGYTNVYSPILDLARDPRWGRVVECYGEDPHHVSALGMQMVRGIQEQRVVSTGKHFAVYSVPKGGRDGNVRTDPHATPREVHEILIAPFRAAVTRAGIMGLMSSYNDYDGVPISASHYFLTELLRDTWGFQGYVVSDSWAVGGLEGRHHIADNFKEAVYLAVMAGLDVRTNFTPPEDFVIPLRELVNEGRIPASVIDDRVRHVLRVKFWLGLFDNPYVPDPDAADALISNTDSDAVSLRASRESLILLKNNGLLPIDKTKIKSVLVTGPNAKSINPIISRYGPSEIDVVTVVDGVKKLLGDSVKVTYTQGCDHYDNNWPENELYYKKPAKEQRQKIEKAVAMAKDADLIIAVVGDNENTVGEGKSRSSLDLPGNQDDLVQALYSTKKTVVVVLMNGRPMTINWIHKYIPAVIEAWFPSEYAGQAIAEAIFGDLNPGGKLPVTFPQSAGQLPYNFPYKTSSQLDQPVHWPERFTTRVNGALYPFGHGLSYTTFDYSDLKISPAAAKTDAQIKVSFTVKNTGKRAGDEVAQLYISDVTASVVTYEKRLRGFRRITLAPGAAQTLEFTLTPEDLSLFNMDMQQVVEPGLFKIFAGSSSEDIRLTGELTIKE
jgi:beta-glucosidase